MKYLRALENTHTQTHTQDLPAELEMLLLSESL